MSDFVVIRPLFMYSVPCNLCMATIVRQFWSLAQLQRKFILAITERIGYQEPFDLQCSITIYGASPSFLLTEESGQAEIRNFRHHIVIKQYVCRF